MQNQCCIVPREGSNLPEKLDVEDWLLEVSSSVAGTHSSSRCSWAPGNIPAAFLLPCPPLELACCSDTIQTEFRGKEYVSEKRIPLPQRSEMVGSQLECLRLEWEGRQRKGQDDGCGNLFRIKLFYFIFF